jgi:transposase
MQGKKAYQEKLFMSFRLSDRVPEDNFYRRLNSTLDLKWLYKATKSYYGKEGQQSIDPVVFFKLILIGYFENLGSDRRIVNTVSMRMDTLLFIGYDIDEELPWHSTLSRTRQLYDKEVFKQLFQRVLTQCIDKGMVAGRRQAIDSVFIKANASMDSLVAKEILEDGLTYADTLCEQEAENKTKLNDKYRSTTDSDARVSTKSGKPSALNYLAQVSVDTGGHVITNIDVHHADKSDNQCFEEVLLQTKNNLTTNGLVIEEVLADTGYSSGAALQCLEDNNIEGYIPNKSGYKSEREGFVYDSVKDEFVCSQGAVLSFSARAPGKGGRYRKVYLSSKTDCSLCPLRAQCIGKSLTKKITVSEDSPLYDKMVRRLQTPKGKRMCRLRGSTVEPVLGTLVNFLAMKRVNTKGIEQADKCATMAASAYNLKKLMKFRESRPKTMIKVAQRAKIVQKPMFSSLYHVQREIEINAKHHFKSIQSRHTRFKQNL